MTARILKLVTLALGLLLLGAASAVADRITLDFETGPSLGTPVGNDYQAAGFVTFPRNPGYQPVRADVGRLAHSGHVVLNTGVGQCIDEGYQDCEFAPGTTTAVLSKTASSITLFAGEPDAGVTPETVELTGHRTNGTDVSSGPVSIDTSGITKPVSVTSPAADISGFTLTASGGSLAFDDLTFDFPANSLPDIAPTDTNQIVPVLSGGTTPLQVNLNRLNGSNGPVQVSARNLPTGVSAQPVTTTGNTATLNLVGAPDAPSTDFHPVRATVVADPLHNARVAPAVRFANLDVRVASPYELQLPDGTSANVALPACAPVDVPLRLPRDIGMTDTIHLSVPGLPSGLAAQILPSADIAPGGGLTAERTVRFMRISRVPLPADVTVKATSPDGDRTLTLHVDAATPHATVTPGLGLTPRLMSNGTQMTLTGNGFCPGTEVRVGSTFATTDANVIDPHTITFHMPTYAMTGAVTIVPHQGDVAYVTDNSVQVDSFRNTDGFQFRNFDFDGLSLGELTDAFGSDALFIRVNPCGFLGDCSFNTGILNPVAAIEWPIISKALSSSNGHCFGISRAVQEFLSSHRSLRAFTTGGSAFAIPSATHPQTAVGHFLDGQHALQASEEFLNAWFDRDKSVSGQLARAKAALAHGGFPIVTLRHGALTGHAVVAYNAVDNPDGTSDIYVYDSNREFVPGEDASAGLHHSKVQDSIVHMDPVHGKWSFLMADGTTWTGGNGGTLFVAPESVIPQNPSLPGISTVTGGLEYLVFGAPGGAVTTTGSTAGADYLPALDSHAIPGAAGTLVGRGGSVTGHFVGRNNGSYSAALAGHGFIASVENVATASGVHDSVRARGDAITFNGGMSRALTVELAQGMRHPGAAVWSAKVATHADGGQAEAAALTPSGRLTLDHGGRPTTISFTLSSSRAGTFASGPLAVGGGDHLTVTPASGLRSARVTLRTRNGRRHTIIVRNQAKPPASLTVSRPHLTGARVTVRVAIHRLRTRAVMGVVLRALHGRRVLERVMTRATSPRNGTRRFTFRLTRRMHGRIVLAANAQLVTVGSAGASSSVGAASRATVRVR
jgi:hypothetical protein